MITYIRKVITYNYKVINLENELIIYIQSQSHIRRLAVKLFYYLQVYQFHEQFEGKILMTK